MDCRTNCCKNLVHLSSRLMDLVASVTVKIAARRVQGLNDDQCICRIQRREQLDSYNSVSKNFKRSIRPCSSAC